MNIINAGATLMDHIGSEPREFIEKIGRTCYKSENLITSGSAHDFVKRLRNSKHLAMLEHWWVHLVSAGDANRCKTLTRFAANNSYIKLTHISSNIYVSANLATFLYIYDDIITKGRYDVNINIAEMLAAVAEVFEDLFVSDDGMLAFDSYVSNPFIVVSEEEFKEIFRYDMKINGITDYNTELMRHIPHTALFTCDRGVTHELVRHRPCSFAQESTRYCNYSKGKFGSEITVIRPRFFEPGTELYDEWKRGCEEAEKSYFKLLELGAFAQQARDVLPQSVKADIIMTCNETEWQHVINLRYHGTTGDPHPQMQEIMNLWYPIVNRVSEGRVK